jgi:hypothetical protein
MGIQSGLVVSHLIGCRPQRKWKWEPPEGWGEWPEKGPDAKALAEIIAKILEAKGNPLVPLIVKDDEPTCQPEADPDLYPERRIRL